MNTARADQEHLRAYLLAGHASIIEFAKEAMKALLLVSGGSAVATLAFLGQLAGETDLWPLGERLTKSLLLFGIAVLLGAVSLSLSYVSQLLYQLSTAQMAGQGPSAKNTWWAGIAAQALAMSAVLASYILILWGFASAYGGFQEAFSGRLL